jgi:hypothetical protein
VVTRVLAEFLVDQPEAARDRAHRRGAHTLDVGILLQEHEQLEQCRGRSREHIVAARLERSTADLEAGIERPGRLVLAQDRLAEDLQQQLIEEAHVHHGAVVALHQLLDRECVRGILVPEGL